MKIKVKIDELNKMLIVKGFSKRGFAKFAEIGEVTIFNVCKGENVSPAISKKICDALQVKFDEIFTVEPKN